MVKESDWGWDANGSPIEEDIVQSEKDLIGHNYD